MYHVFYTNMGFKSEETFDSIAEALGYGKSKGFEFSVLDVNGATVAHLTAFGGVHYAPGIRKENN